MKFIFTFTALITAAIIFSFSSTISAGTFTVTTVLDTSSSLLTLRQAITDANNNAGKDTILFNISNEGISTIKLMTPLPDIKDSVVIDGTSQPGFSGSPVIEIDGSGITQGTFNGLTVCGGNSIIKGLVIYGFKGTGKNAGIRILSCANIIIGNIIGSGASSSATDQGNDVGIEIAGSKGEYNIIGSKKVADRNIIIGNLQAGIVINGSNKNIVEGNYIGIEPDGVTPAGNGKMAGVWLTNGAKDNTVGGDSTGSGNVISGNYYGIFLDHAQCNNIYRNYIGTDASGNSAAGNYIGIGIDSSKATRIGNTDKGNIITGSTLYGISIQGDKNIIEYNTINKNNSDGVRIISGKSNSILSNSIYSNGGLGISLGNGVVPNDVNDNDSGPNDLLNYPVLTLSSSDVQVVQGKYNSLPDNYFRIEFFSNDEADSSNYGEGQNYLGYLDVKTDSTGNVDFTANLPIAAGKFITATATDSCGNTSEFSEAISTQVFTKTFGNHFVVNTTYSGIPLHWQDGKTTYMISNDIPNSSGNFPAAIQTGYSTWNALSQLNYSDGGITNSTTWGGNPDGINNNVWITSNWEGITGTDPNTIAVTRVRYNAVTGEITDADIAYNAEDFKWSTSLDTSTMDVQNVATHEIGHFGGLGDIYNPANTQYYLPGMGSGNEDETMFGLIKNNETKKRDLDTGDTEGIQFIYNNLKSSRLDFMLVFDGSSGYTSVPNALDQAKKSAVELVDNLRFGDKIGVVELPSNLILPLTSVDNDSVKTYIKNIIINISGGGTSGLGSGLQTSQNQLKVNGESTHLPVILLYSTGAESGSPTVSDVLPSISSTSTEIFTIGFKGTNTSFQNNLNLLSSATKGGYSLADDATQIGNIVNSYFLALTGVQLIFSKTGSSFDLQGVPAPGIRWQGALVDTGALGIQPGIRWQGSDFGLVLQDPDGNMINQDSAQSNPNIQYFSGANYKYYKIKYPKPGSWSIYVYGISLPSTPEAYTVYMAEETDVTMSILFNKERFAMGDTVIVQARLYNGGGRQSDVHIVSGTPVIGADVQATVVFPDSSVQTLSFTPAGDGIYKTEFINTSSSGNYNFNITANVAGEFNRAYSKTIFVINPDTSEVNATDKVDLTPRKFDLFQNYPNPFNPTTEIKYQIPYTSMVRLKIFNILGQLIKTLVNSDQRAGNYQVRWNGTNNYGEKVSSGIYIYRIESGNFISNKKMILLK